MAVCGGFSRAAEFLARSQPAISDQIRKLEEYYDIVLFDRGKKQISLTEPGQRLLELTHRLFDVEQQALDLLAETRALRTGTLRIVSSSTNSIVPILAEFRRIHPGVRISLKGGNSESVVADLLSYNADIGVLGEISVGRQFKILQLKSTPIVAFVKRGHELATAKSVTIPELAALPLVMRERGSKTRQRLEAAAAVEGVDLQPAIVAEGRETIREIVASGSGVGFVSAAEFGHDVRLAAIPIDAPQLLMDEAIVCLSDRSTGKLVQAFWQIAERLGPLASA